jgi:2-polyprenyl-3-methyl-5-hydroxy-6-metoxy-1,4-benzoquinol methylase
MVYDTINPKIVKFILEDTKPGISILDVGCGTGKLGRELKSKINCQLTGIEIDKEALKSAEETYDKVVFMDLEDLVRGRCVFDAQKKYDYIVFGDILEHVSQPQALLSYFNPVLAENGFMIASIPNVANWMVRLGLVFGRFDYSVGILDKGHLRFFTYRSAKNLIQDSGYKIVKVTNNNATLACKVLGRLWMRMFAFQFVFKCKKSLF